MLNLARLRVLQEVVARGSFSAAAEALDYTQSAVSQAVARLEAETGAPLVVRDRRGVRATAAGATLLGHAEAILAQVQAAEDELAAVIGLRGGRLRMASFPSAGSTLMPRAVATFRGRHPDITLSLAEGEPDEIAPRLRAGELDLALLFEFPGVREAPDETLRIAPLLEDPLDVALPADHELASRPALTLADLAEEEWVQTSSSSPYARQVVRSCLMAGFEPRVSFESDDYETVQGLVAAGVGVALIPRLALARVHAGVIVRSLTPSSPSRSVVVATPPEPSVSPAARAMLQILIDLAEGGDHGAKPRRPAPAPPRPRNIRAQ
jgi:DNA-binding transcriptional LysR family regulator